MLGGYLWITTEEEREQCFAVRRAAFMEEQDFANDSSQSYINRYAVSN